MKELQRDIEYLVSEELTRANKKNPLFHSDHEAYGVIDEEVREIIDEAELIVAGCAGFRTSVHRDYPKGVKGEAIVIIKEAAIRCACEAVQVAAMCDKWVASNEKNADGGYTQNY